MKTLLIDADSFAYYAAIRGQTPFGFAVDKAEEWLVESFVKLTEGLGAGGYLIVLSDPSRYYFRHTVFPKYKAYRTQGVPPEGVSACKDILYSWASTRWVEGLEADDVLGILATSTPNTIIVSDDKDLRTIPGELYVPRLGQTFEISEDEADWNHLMQTLTGDSCDGFGGCPFIGPKRAEKLLSDALTEGKLDRSAAWQIVLDAYERRGLSESEAITQARLARILRAENWDNSNKKVILWTPPFLLS